MPCVCVTKYKLALPKALPTSISCDTCEVALDSHPILKKICIKLGQFCSCSGSTANAMVDDDDALPDLDAVCMPCQVHQGPGMHLCDFLLDLGSVLFDVLPEPLFEAIETAMVAGTQEPFKDKGCLVRAAQLRFKIMQKLIPSVLRGLPSDRLYANPKAYNPIYRI